MENWDKPLRDNHRKQHHHRENPSFSSTLLDAIYRSIDEGESEEKQQDQLIFYRETAMRKQKQNNNSFKEGSGEGCFAAEKSSSRRARKVENWMDKKANDKVVAMGRNSLTELERRSRSNSSNALSMYSSSTSSESSSAGGFSSSESESLYGLHRPKPIRTSFSEKTNFDKNIRNHHHHHHHHHHPSQPQKPKHENGFGKTKSKALRILYGDLKKTKQPISPGARLASFLNSLFTSSGSAKKAKVSSPVIVHESNSAQQGGGGGGGGGSSACSSASSFSRSCLSKTPSSRTGAKRSVRFGPVSVIVDEDCRPCGHKNLHEGHEEGNLVLAKGYGKSSNSEELRFHVLQESRRVEELARDLLKNYQKKKKKKNEQQDFDMMHYDEDDDEDDDDGASCSSSDLFELDNLSAIGIERYREELPVYETTHFSTNRAIANGFIL